MRVRTWAEFREEWDKAQQLDEERAAKRMAVLTGICPQCGDGGFWIDDTGRHVCDCEAGRKLIPAGDVGNAGKG